MAKGKNYRKTITVADVADAIEENGIPQIVGHFTHSVDGEVIGACAIGQAAINLGVHPKSLQYELDKLFNKGDYRALGGQIISWNDSNRYSYKVIANKIRESFADSLNKELNPTKR